MRLYFGVINKESLEKLKKRLAVRSLPKDNSSFIHGSLLHVILCKQIKIGNKRQFPDKCLPKKTEIVKFPFLSSVYVKLIS